ncbi:hypothetical protein C8T65DRAFT_737121 [Cerioporus squamosus]|nr:hypothetical protein C8T65DRAFT_737121 [Cerioporus squamosus]
MGILNPTHAMTSFTSLPTEIVVQILSSVDAKEPWRLYQLGHVCGGWRAIVEDSPRFWANVVANTWYFPRPALSQSLILKFYCDAIERSAPYSLAVSVDLSFNSVASRACVSRNFVTALVPYGPRLSSMTLVLDSKMAGSLHRLLCSGLSLLEDLAVTLGGADSIADRLARYTLYHFPGRAALPRLHTLRISGALLGPWLAGPSLAHLDVIGAPKNDHRRVPSWGLFIRVLERCPLKTLKLSHALPMLVWPDETEELLRWPGQGALQALDSCTVEDEAAAIISFSMFLGTAPLPPDALLDVTLASPTTTNKYFSDKLFSLAFCRGPPHLPRRVELDRSLRVYVGDKKLTEIKLSPSPRPTAHEPLAQTLFLNMPFDCDVRDRQGESTRADYDITELALTLENDPIRSDLWNAMFTLLPYLRHIELRFAAPPAPLGLGPDEQAALFLEQSRTTASLLAYLSSRTATADGPCCLLLLEGLHIHGLRLGEDEAHDLSQKIVSVLATRANDGGPVVPEVDVTLWPYVDPPLLRPGRI